MIAIDLKLLKAAALFAGTEETRYYLNGVCLQGAPDGSLVYVATDGHKLFAARDTKAIAVADKLTADIVIPNDVIKGIKLDKRGDNIASLDLIRRCEGGNWTITLSLAAGTSVGFKPIDGTFPDWRRVIPATTSGKVAQFDSRNLEACRKAGELLGRGLPTVAHNGEGPALVGWPTGDCFAVVMPIRSGVVSLPAWVKPSAAPALDTAA